MNSTGYLCNLILPGAGKSGTSSLHVMLGKHPQLSFSDPKEPQHFSFDPLYKGGPDTHNAMFSRNDEVIYFGESSQCYMVHPHAIERIARHCRDPRIIFLLRDPIGRLLSHYAWAFRLGTEHRPLRAAIEELGEETGYEFDPSAGMYRPLGGYLAFSHYATWIPRWQAEFGEDRVLLLRTEDLRASPAATLKRCWQFLGVPEIPFESEVVANQTSSNFRLAIPKPLLAIARAIPTRAKGRTYRFVRDIIWRQLTARPDTRLDDEDRRSIENWLAADIAFYAALGPGR